MAAGWWKLLHTVLAFMFIVTGIVAFIHPGNTFLALAAVFSVVSPTGSSAGRVATDSSSDLIALSSGESSRRAVTRLSNSLRFTGG